MISSTIPSAKYSCSRSPLILSNGSTAIDGLSGSGRGFGVVAVLPGTSFTFSASQVTTPTKRKPLRETVRINRCSSPVSPIAWRAALMRVVGNETSGPNRVQQVILGDHALSILNQINQQIENLRPDGDLLGTSPKLAPVTRQILQGPRLTEAIPDVRPRAEKCA